MDIDGPVLIYRWRGPVSVSDSTFVFENKLEKYEFHKVDDANGKAVDMDLVTLTWRQRDGSATGI